MASQELASRPTCDSTLQMRHFSHKFQTLVIHKGSITRWVRGWFTPATELKKLRKCTDFTQSLSQNAKLNKTVILPTTVTIHTSTYVKPEIQTADMRKVIMNHFFQNLLLQSGMVRKSRVMMGRDRTQKIRFRSLSGTANTLLCSAGMQAGKHVYEQICITSSGVVHTCWKYWCTRVAKKCVLPSGISLRPCRLRDRWEYPESSWKIPLSVLERLWTRRLVSSFQPIRGRVSVFSLDPLPRQVQQGLSFLRTNSLMRRSKHRTTM